MTRTITRSAAIAAILLVGLSANRAWAIATTTDVALDSLLVAGLSGTGSVNVTSASGNYLYWTSVNVPIIGTQYTNFNIGLSANNQNIGLVMNPVNANVSISNSSTTSLTYDNDPTGAGNVVPTLNSLNGNLLDAAHAVPFTINTTNSLNITGSQSLGSLFGISLGSISITVPVNLTINGTITDISFQSTGGSTANSLYSIPGNVSVTLQGSVSGTIPYITVFGIQIPVNIGLGTISSIGPLTEVIPTSLPGNLVLNDVTGGAGPYPADLGLQMLAGAGGTFDLPVSLPLDTAYSASLTDHNSGLTSLVIAPGSMVNADLSVTDPGYFFNGTVHNGLVQVPEPSSLALGGLALLGLVGFIARRNRAA